MTKYTVKTLIEELKKHDPNMNVLVHDIGCVRCSNSLVELEEINVIERRCDKDKLSCDEISRSGLTLLNENKE
jgi:hypothetical protein